MRTATCTYHCSECGSHFSSLAAFDSHRQGEFGEGKFGDGRFCEEPEDVLDSTGNLRLTPLSVEGECRLARPPKVGVTVWTDAKSLERARTKWAAA